MHKYLVIVATRHDVHPVAGHDAGGQGDGHRASAVLSTIWLKLKKPDMLYHS